MNRAGLSSLVSSVDLIRNVCILAHVDHGKTTLADALLATNGIVSSRQAGKLRYMDNTEAEQERGITMKSSVVSLVFDPGSVKSDSKSKKTYLINLVDSPGHVDFAPEVSTAVRLCDGAIVVVDVIEGVCPQTRTVLRQAWNERLTLILVLNKIDRLVVELKLTAMQAYEVICRCIEQVNSVLAEMFTSDVMRQRYDFWRSSQVTKDSNTTDLNQSQEIYDWSTGLEISDDSNLYFAPDRGNVVFTSSIDSWGFRVQDFVQTWSERLRLPGPELGRTLWGNYYLSMLSDPGQPSRTSVKMGAREKNKKPTFVQLILDPLWSAYETLDIPNNQDKIISMASKLGVTIDKRALRNVDNRGQLRAFLSSWLPLGRTVMSSIVDICPCPIGAVSADRAVHMLYGDVAPQISSSEDYEPKLDQKLPTQIDQISRIPVCSIYAKTGASLALQVCSSEPSAPTIVFIAKVFWTDKLRPTSMSKTQPTSEHEPNLVNPSDHQSSTTLDGHLNLCSPLLMSNPFADADFVALARIFSGSLRAGQRLFVLGPKFDGSKVPAYLLDADPSDFPLGPVRIKTEADSANSGSFFQDPDIPNEPATADLPISRTPTNMRTSLSGSVGGGSSCGEAGGPRYLRHVYVASIDSILQFTGGQSDYVQIPGPIPSGNIVGLTGPELITCLPKSGLLVSRLSLVANMEVDEFGVAKTIPSVLPLAGLAVWHGAPVISVAVEPASAANPNDVHRLERGLRLLDRADPCAEITITSGGEYLIRAAGEVHLQKCLDDLSKYFAPDIELHISPFVVPFRETVIDACSPTYPNLTSLASSSYDRACADLEFMLQKLNIDVPSIRPAGTKTDVTSSNVQHETDSVSGVAPVPTDSGANTGGLPTEPSVYPKATTITISDSKPIVSSVIRKPFPTVSKTHSKCSTNLDLPECAVGVFQLPHSKSRTRVLIRVSAHPMPGSLLEWIESSGSTKISQLIRAFKNKSPNYQNLLSKFESNFASICQTLASDSSKSNETTCDIQWTEMPNRLLALGPNQMGPNMLFTRMKTDCFPLCTAWGCKFNPPNLFSTENRPKKVTSLPLISYGKALLRGFELATRRGPLCAEPMRGIVFILEEIVAENHCLLEVILPTEQPNSVTNEPLEDGDGVTEPIQDEDTKAPSDTTGRQSSNQVSGQPRRKPKRLTSISWMEDYDEFEGDGDDEDDDGDDDMDYSGSGDDDWRDSMSEESADDVRSDFENESDQDESGDYTAQPDKPDPTAEDLAKGIPYWQRRTDTDWIYDTPPGLLTPAMTRACLSAFQACPTQRLMLAMYDVELQARGDVLGRMFAVLRKRHGYVVNEDFREGENTFVISARLPVIESFGLADELRKRTSGKVNLPQLRPGGWELLNIDPSQHDTTSGTDKQDLGKTQLSKKYNPSRDDKPHRLGAKPASNRSDDDTDEENMDESQAQFSRVQKYIRDVRRRKGLPTNEQLVLYADKQRTLKKNK